MPLFMQFFPSSKDHPFIVCRFFDDGHSDQCEVIPHCKLIYISLIISNAEHVFMCLLATLCLLWRNVYLGLPPIFFFLDWVFVVVVITELHELFVYLEINRSNLNVHRQMNG